MMKKKGQALAQGFIAFIVMACRDRRFEQQMLDVLGKTTPYRDHSRAQCQGKWSIAIGGHERLLIPVTQTPAAAGRFLAHRTALRRFF